ncbi:MAG: ribonuclease Z [Deltaproteobacteria bacterium]|nr:MAG: ribonuclease Z [Deltaproteobacteria bacterium]
MVPRFLPRPVNGPFEDPALYIAFRHEKRALLFDMGDLDGLSSRDILKISHVFVTHTHMDHFSGFDRVLRLLLGRDKDLHLYGPQGFLANVSGKLAGYCWNLVENYDNRFILHATELHPDRALTCSYPCRNAFKIERGIRETPFNGTVVEEAGLSVRAVHLDHGTPILAFRLNERFHINIVNTTLNEMGLPAGPWLNRFKTMLYEQADPNTMVDIPGHQPGEPVRRLPLNVLKDRIAHISPGQQLAYVVDVTGNDANLERIVDFAHGVDQLFVEAAFSHDHRDIALKKHHLTARQAGELARRCGAKQYRLFHHSPRYADCPQRLEAEAAQAFGLL